MDIKAEKEEELLFSKRKKILSNLIGKLSEEDPESYYLPAKYVSNIVQKMISNREGLNSTEYELVKDLSADDIHVLISRAH